MSINKTAKGLLSQALSLPMNLFADDESRVLARLDDLHRNLPATLPQKRFFRH